MTSTASTRPSALDDGSVEAASRPQPGRLLGVVLQVLRRPMAVDAVLIATVVWFATLLAPFASVDPLVVALVSSALVTGTARSMRVYSVAGADTPAILARRLLVTLAISAGIFLLFAYVTDVLHDRSWLPLAVGGVVMVTALHRLIAFGIRSHPRTSRHFVTRLALLGEAESIAQFDELDHGDAGLVIVERMQLTTDRDIRPALRQVDELAARARAGEIDRVVVLASAPGTPVVNAVVRRCSMGGISVDALTGAFGVRPSRLETGRVHGFTTMHIRPGLHGPYRVASKRAFDLVVAAVALVLLSPVFAVIALAVKADSRGPVFYKQRRLGRLGQQFEMVKFRSMSPGADQLVVDLTDQNDADGPLFKMKSDPRITRVGRIIRRTSIDELPQLWNVLRGDMSLVGPRPALAVEADGWPIELFDRLEVAPGITGLWQVSGRSNASFADYQRLDLYYVDNWTFGLDIAILVRTLPALLGRGAY